VSASGLYLVLLGPFQRIWVSYDQTNTVLAGMFALYIVCASVYRLDFAVLYARSRFSELLVLTIVEVLGKYALAWCLVPFFGPACTIAAHAVAHLLILQWYAKFLVRKQFTVITQPL
jgi:cytochrome b subunit of formate dehydrogenase